MSVIKTLFIILSSLVCLVAGVSCDSGSDSVSNGGGECRQAKEIEDDRARVEGYIEDVGSSRLIVFATVVIVTPQTEITGEHGAGLQFSDLLVGMCVDVRGPLNAEGEVVAERIDVEDREDSS
ncbi:MAG: DUF5666 domain-containing protein [Candidatus Krumholzibacteria bacterium]|nr:DUF5666 domain-containing protein [Candidatus Krumholzibacteria bacterium]